MPALPADVMGCIARATLAAEKRTMSARARLSLVCRAWRGQPPRCVDSMSLRLFHDALTCSSFLSWGKQRHAGELLHLDTREQLSAEQLRGALTSARFSSVRLHSSQTLMQSVQALSCQRWRAQHPRSPPCMACRCCQSTWRWDSQHSHSCAPLPYGTLHTVLTGCMLLSCR